MFENFPTDALKKLVTETFVKNRFLIVKIIGNVRLNVLVNVSETRERRKPRKNLIENTMLN